MKKNLFKTLFIATGATLIFSACLGDTESTTSATNAFAYISQTSTVGEKTAIADGILMTSDELRNDQRLQSGDCVFVSYKVNWNNVVGGVCQADYVKINEANSTSGKIFKESEQVKTITGVKPEMEVTGDDLYFTFVPSTIGATFLPMNMVSYGYRWFIEYKYDNDAVSPALLNLYYDATNQKDKDGNDLTKGEVIIDFRLERQGTENSSGKIVDTLGQTVINFRNMVNVLEDKAENNVVKIKFRYFKKKLSVTGEEVPYELYISPAVTQVTYSKENSNS